MAVSDFSYCVKIAYSYCSCHSRRANDAERDAIDIFLQPGTTTRISVVRYHIKFYEIMKTINPYILQVYKKLNLSHLL